MTASATNTAFLTALYIIASVGLSWLIFRRRPGKRLWLAVALSIGGALGLAGGRCPGSGRGDWLVLGSAFFWGAYAITTEGAGRYGRPITYTCGMFAVVALCAIGPR